MLVTTAYQPSGALVAEAKRVAAQWKWVYVPRRTDSLLKLWQRYGENDVLVVTQQGMKLYRYGDDPLHPLFFHPGMSALRIERLQRGESDRMLEAADCQSGDVVLDCTAGLCADAIVFSHRVGERGRVIALESEAAVAAVVQSGLKRYESGNADLVAAMRRVELIHTGHLDYLRRLADKSADIVYFDPMFRVPVEASAAIAPLRRVANSDPLQEEAVREAVRVARKRIVMKEAHGSGEFARLGFQLWNPKGSSTEFGVIDCS